MDKIKLQKLLGANIQKLRNELHMSQSILAETIDVTIEYISKIENGRSYPKIDKLLKISQALQVSLNELFKFDTDEKSSANKDKIIERRSKKDGMLIELDSILKRLDDKSVKQILSLSRFIQSHLAQH